MGKQSFNLPLRKRIRNIGRFVQIVNVFARHGYWTVMKRLDMRGVLSDDELRTAQEQSDAANTAFGNSSSPTESLPMRLRRSLEELGPAFVKLGQILAVREDLLPAEFTDELRKLHSAVESLPFEVISQRLREELGPDRLAQFEHIDERPLAAGSIAQVHAARLKGGIEVVIKVQRPAIAQQIDIDLDLMLTFAELFEKYIPESRFARPRAMVQSIASALRNELDFIREAGSMTKMAANFVEINHIHIPRVQWDLTTPRVLTIEFMSGMPIDSREQIINAGIDIKLLVERGLHMFLRMVFVDGFFHGDLHPGNLLAKPGAEIGLLDFGMVVRLSRNTRENLASMLVALTREDYEGMVHHYFEIADPDPTTDIHAFQHEIANALTPFVGLSLRQARSARVLWDLARIAARHNAPFPQDLIIYVKTMATFEGVGTRLDPNFDIMKLCGTFASELVSEIYSPKHLQDQALHIARDLSALVRHAPLMTRRILSSALDGQLKINIHSDEVNRLARAVDRSSSRLAVSIVVGALVIGSSILTFSSTGAASLPLIGLGGFILAGLLGLYIIVSVVRSGRL